jgi:hypothetical protein
MNRDDEGAITLYVVITMTALLAAFGLIVDVGTATAAKGRAIHAAFAAARAGADALSNETFVTTGHVNIDVAGARRAATTYLVEVGLAEDATITVSGSTVRVTVRHTEHPRILNAFGLSGITVAGSGEATAVYGVQGAAP